MEMGTKDQTQYKINNGIFAKGRLVLEIVKKYVKDNPKITYQELKNIFPDNLQANSQFQFSDIQTVVMKIEDIIYLADTKIAVSREWNRENIQNFINKAGMLGFSIEVSAV